MTDILPIAKLVSQLDEYFEDIFGKERWKSIQSALSRPSLKTTLRVNTTKTNCDEVLTELGNVFCTDDLQKYRPCAEKDVSSVVTLHGEGPTILERSLCNGAKEVQISKKTGEAVLRGAHVFAPGVMAATAGVEEGDTVVVTVQIGDCTITRGTIISASSVAERQRFEIGIGVCQMSRTALFRELNGLAIHITKRLYNSPPCNGILKGKVMLQNLPSIVAAQVVDPKPGWRVLDMCAAPGGKTTAMAELMQDEGEIIAMDRTNKKAASVQCLAEELGLTCIRVYRMDATKAVLDPTIADQQFCAAKHPSHHMAARLARKEATRLRCKQQPLKQIPSISKSNGFSKASFDAVLLDAPCSALGLRPRLEYSQTLQELEETAQYQRCLLSTAVQLVKSGGILVYSTCTINPGENEANVRFVLDHYPTLQLVSQSPRIGGDGLIGEKWLKIDESGLVQRFYPDDDNDTIGFFIAKFLKGN